MHTANKKIHVNIQTTQFIYKNCAYQYGEILNPHSIKNDRKHFLSDIRVFKNQSQILHPHCIHCIYASKLRQSFLQLQLSSLPASRNRFAAK